MSADVIALRPRFDPFSEAAERHYDGLVLRINGLRVQIRKLARQTAELERQFVENDLVAASGARRGRPLGPVARRRRLTKLRGLYDEMGQWQSEEHQLVEHLDRLHTALEEWAGETLGEPAPDEPGASEPESGC